MAEKLALYFCPNKECETHQKTYRQKGNCPNCGTHMERIKYCPDCQRAGTPYQNLLCHYCKKYLVDFFYGDNYMPKKGDNKDYYT
ncbi:MAG: hypothetical protein ABIH39_00310 [Candidatus Margulisiibacteriota bacterium]